MEEQKIFVTSYHLLDRLYTVKAQKHLLDLFQLYPQEFTYSCTNACIFDFGLKACLDNFWK